MSLLATLALAASTSTASLPACSWDRPGVNPFTGDLVAAVDRYKDIPPATREKLKARLKQRSYEDIALITRDRIEGKAEYAEIRDMHFGTGRICRTVTRGKWSNSHQERGLVYCEDGQCLIVPTVCRNLSRVTRLEPRPVAGAAQDDEAVLAAAPAEEAPLVFDPPAAGQPAAAPESFAAIAAIPRLDAPAAVLSLPPMISGSGPVVTTPVGGVPPLPPGTLRPDPELPLPIDPGITPAVPEPGTWALFGLGLGVLLLRRRRRAR